MLECTTNKMTAVMKNKVTRNKNNLKCLEEKILM